MNSTSNINDLYTIMFGGGDNLLRTLLEEEFFNENTLAEKIHFFSSEKFDFHSLRYCIFLLNKVLVAPNFILTDKIEDIEEFTSIWEVQKRRIIRITDDMLSLCKLYNSLIKNVDRSFTDNMIDNAFQRNNYNLTNEFTIDSKESFLQLFDTNANSFITTFESATYFLYNYSNVKSAENIVEKFYESTKHVIDIKKLQDDAEIMVGLIGDLPTTREINNYAGIFEIESNKFMQEASLWLERASYIIGIIVALVLLNFYLIEVNHWSNLSTSDTIQISLSKLVVLSILLYILSVCVKNYKYCKHNEVLNKHRENALKSFQAFVSSPKSDESTKDAILLEVTRTIFSQQQTGYIIADQDESPTKIIEIFKSFSPK